ncbi:C-type lectin-like [Protopterus annectens]|uniref:C-type lectin-like n=1 Tax=Protopterus annectens TaxID=7888 RepID=UPI001CFA9BF7|nr:C-type lectin-like [Protopterus annectens]
MALLLALLVSLPAFVTVGDAQMFPAGTKETCMCVQGDCPDTWFQYKDACYKPVMTKMTWPNAEAHCQDHFNGAHLASVHTQEENQFIFTLMGKPNDYRKGQAYWIGAHDTFKEGKFMWTDGTDMDFRRFGQGRPNGLPGEHYVGSCIIQNGDVTWNDYGLSSSYPFICKQKLKKSSRCSADSPCEGCTVLREPMRGMGATQ